MVALKDFKTKEEPLRSLLGLLLSRNCNSNLICALGLSVTIMLLHSTSFSAYTYISGTPVRRYWHLGYLAVSSISFCISMQSHVCNRAFCLSFAAGRCFPTPDNSTCDCLTVKATMDCMLMKLPNDWEYQSIRSSLLLFLAALFHSSTLTCELILHLVSLSREAIDYYVDIGHIYSTIDDYHFKSAFID
ncbi:hypothetical protein BHE74_00026632 [Ensete ventricosum]|nr:hypothetical protein BHE74_00026632 [Ensete ventricosum]RZS08098.1 hypothetical protein BHM03_00039031 [Ensete ventricosum]